MYHILSIFFKNDFLQMLLVLSVKKARRTLITLYRSVEFYSNYGSHSINKERQCLGACTYLSGDVADAVVAEARAASTTDCMRLVSGTSRSSSKSHADGLECLGSERLRGWANFEEGGGSVISPGLDFKAVLLHCFVN
ncbi:hypothetical protein J1N35_021146 [Gossypium stocksii]|uniref:Uncharacterized protein n=1 Tax=Gossypium stocksii TaxID=47602 RepID=A0A9D4A1P5_9ROSI|nr:hypothetical protein J1N35_021146 [Gossypium stocksii]